MIGWHHQPNGHEFEQTRGDGERQGVLQSMGSQRVGHDWIEEQQPGFRHCCCSITQWCLTLCDCMDCSMPRFPVLQYLPEFAQTFVHWVNDAIQLSYPLSPPSPPALNLSQHQSVFQWVSSSHQRAKELELRQQSIQWVFRVDLLVWL